MGPDLTLCGGVRDRSLFGMGITRGGADATSTRLSRLRSLCSRLTIEALNALNGG